VSERVSARALERRHVAGSQPWWEESWSLDFAAPDGSLGGFIRIALLPNRSRAWCWVYVVRDDGTVVVRDHDVPLPPANALLARSEALWCEMVCETPMEHWSYGVEAFGVRLDEPSDALHGEVGTRLPVGLELEWERAVPPVATDTDTNTDTESAARGDDGGRYEQPGIVHGDVLLGDEVIPFDGTGVRAHAWGEHAWSRPASRVAWATDAGAALVVATEPALEATFDDRGMLAAASVRGDVSVDVSVDVTPLLHAPVPLAEVGDGDAWLARTLVRVTATGAGPAHGWFERLHPGRRATVRRRGVG
jgi:hypothetical protein